MNEQLDKLKNRSSKNSSVQPSSAQLKKPSDKSKRKKKPLQVSKVLRAALCIHRHYHLGKLSREAIAHHFQTLPSAIAPLCLKLNQKAIASHKKEG